VHELASRESDADLGPVKITGADTTHDGLHVAFGRSISRPGTPDDEPGGPRGGGFPGFAGWQDFGGEDDDEGGDENDLAVRARAPLLAPCLSTLCPELAYNAHHFTAREVFNMNQGGELLPYVSAPAKFRLF